MSFSLSIYNKWFVVFLDLIFPDYTIWVILFNQYVMIITSYSVHSDRILALISCLIFLLSANPISWLFLLYFHVCVFVLFLLSFIEFFCFVFQNIFFYCTVVYLDGRINKIGILSLFFLKNNFLLSLILLWINEYILY